MYAAGKQIKCKRRRKTVLCEFYKMFFVLFSKTTETDFYGETSIASRF